MPLVQIKYPNALNDSKTYFDQPVKKNKKRMKHLKNKEIILYKKKFIGLFV